MAELMARGEYTRSRLLAGWGAGGRICPAAPWPELAARLEDCNLPRPKQDTRSGSPSQQCINLSGMHAFIPSQKIPGTGISMLAMMIFLMSNYL